MVNLFLPPLALVADVSCCGMPIRFLISVIAGHQ
jgi:hypothetical protein